jgi:hypothetical protein
MPQDDKKPKQIDGEGAGGGGVVEVIIKAIPLHKMNRHQVANLAFEIVALHYTAQFAGKMGATIPVLALWFSTVAFCLFCVMWACRQ